MNTEIKRHIDAARQVLVGVVPNPTSQIDQITNALIYKFMDDMDQSAIKAGGEPSFFVGDLERYAWTRLMDTRTGNQDRMNLYQEALIKFSEAKQLPELFRGIFKSAFLPYRSPEVLGLFLKEINYFDYSHPEELGNAYEYLLSVMGSQGDAGQFRTPRHIIDFMVDVVNPTKDDKVLDPACGTGGFLVSSYKHILQQHDEKKPLTPDQRKNLMNNFEGYDIDPTMVRIAQVNTYLHQFKNPKIFQYDTLSMEERWNDKFDVILANPPFMSPKGGVSTHSKFSIESSRSEVLFVDFIMNHLRPKGRAGVIVPEGIIFQSGKSHKELRKNLVNDGLYAVVSLPSGVFAPYSGVKTSILFFDNDLAKQSKEILFIKIENDGFDLGATKRVIIKNNLPEAIEILNKWREGKKVESKLAIYVEKSKISENGDYNLSIDMYRIVTDYSNAKWPMVELGEVAEILNGYAFESEKYVDEGIRVIRITNVQKGKIVDDGPKFYPNGSSKKIEKFLLNKNDLLISLTGNVGRVGLLQSYLLPAGLNQRVGCIRLIDNKKVLIDYIFCVLNTDLFEDDCIKSASGIAQKNLSTEWLKKYKIPLPPIDVQEKVVEMVNGYQKIVDGIEQAVSNWKPIIEIGSDWKEVKLGEACELSSGGTPLVSKTEYWNGSFPWYSSGELNEHYTTNPKKFITQKGIDNSNTKIFPKNSLLIGMYDTAALKMSLLDREACFNQAIAGVKPSKLIDMEFLKLFLEHNKEYYLSQRVGVRQRNLSLSFFKELIISLPSVEMQKNIVKEIEIERTAIEQFKNFKKIFEKRIEDVISKLWEE